MSSPASPSTSVSTTTSVKTVGHLVSFDDKSRSSPYDVVEKDRGVLCMDEFNKRTAMDALPNVPMLPLTTADIMDCFRLYFGTNVTMFPFYASRLGAIGIAITIFGAVFLNVQTQTALHRARYNIVLTELYRRIRDAKGQGGNRETTGDEDTTAIVQVDMGFGGSRSISGFDAIKSCKSKISTTPTSPHSGVQKLDIIYSAEAALSRLGTLSHQEMTNKTSCNSGCEKLEYPDSVNSCAAETTMVPYFTDNLGTLAKTSDILWPTHWIKQAITFCTVLAQFFSSCCFAMLFASNVAPIIGISTSNSIYLCSAAMGVLTLATSYHARTALAYANNLFIFGGAALLLVASLAHEKTEEERAMPLQLMPKSFSQLVIYAPSVIAYLAPQLVTIDTETVVGDRVYNFYLKSNQPSPKEGPQPFDSSESSSNGPLNVLVRSLGVVNMLRNSYMRALHIGAIFSGLILLFFAEVLMWIFRDNTNSVITLSLPDSLLRTAILATLSAGLYACGVLNINPIANLMDTFVAKLSEHSKVIQPMVGRVASRIAFFILVAAFLHVVPFFDLVVGFSGAVTTPIFVFFVPTACELQSEMLRAAVETQKSKCDDGQTVIYDSIHSSSFLIMGWRRMPQKSKVLAVFSVICGLLVMFLSTAMVIAEVVRRRNDGVQ